ncbi:integrin alpha-M-like isoform X2 [Synchiropus splendidus]|uniref:integrin alpha-M-like isoform X2 n=1 Tax=Synchiropus splendidus TaxID=270530 RepID=UPI00237DD898|nr:integrin alpha-M-like isoform X2 [Synchiropus splendidus]
MREWHRIALMLAVSAVSWSFNIDTTHPKVYSGEKDDFFGYKVLQLTSGPTKGIIVTAPLQLNGSGAVCRHDFTQAPRCFHPKELPLESNNVPVKHLGLSIAEDPSLSQFTVCSPHVAHECYENSYVNSVCYNLKNDLQEVESFKPVFQDCTKKVVNLVFLFDGSGSMGEIDFKKNKDFILNIMSSLGDTSIKFAAVQFASEHRTVFTFNDYTNGLAQEKIEREPHMMSLTNTYAALEFLLDTIFDNTADGASPDATKVLVLITDGNPTDMDYENNTIIKTYDKKSIIRFVIGVKIANMDKIQEIASHPKKNNTFKIEDYNGLTGILENFQTHLFSVEGSTVARAGEMTKEMSQSGFSLVAHKDTLILGSVGSNSWRGALHERQKESENQIEDPLMEKDSYMGYSIAVAEKNEVRLYFTGAPRFKHVGQIVIFKKEAKNSTVVQKINGERIGSYFGAELCSVDIDSDGVTDFLLVAAPLFFVPEDKTEGKFYVYSLTDELRLNSVLSVTAPSMGRFGTTIASLADLNGDALRDVAVGAPLEDESRGVVYIFLGDKQNGIRSTFHQRIRGRAMGPGLRFFGQAIDGQMDLGEDGLTDIVVGSQGAVIVLRSRPVFHAEAILSFRPAEINIDKIDCLGDSKVNLPMVGIEACFEMTERTKSKAVDPRINISYALHVDPVRQTSRGFFIIDDQRRRNMSSQLELRDSATCFNYAIFMPVCVSDTLSPISIKLNFWQVGSEESSAVLNVDGEREVLVEVPFKKECRNKIKCIAELEVDFNTTTPVLMVAEDSTFNMTITLSNRGDDSYNTSLTILYPPGLSFSRMTAVGPTLHSCQDIDAIDRTTCGVSLPVFRSRSVATFLVTFRILTEFEWNSLVSLTVTGKSDNSNSSRSSLTTQLPVQFEIKLTVIESNIDYIDFTDEDFRAKTITAVYMVNNPGWKAFPVNVSLLFPTKLAHNFEMKNYAVTVKQSQTQCRDDGDGKSQYCSADKRCRLFTCDTFLLEKESSVEFNLTGEVQFTQLQERAAARAFLQRFKGDGAEVQFRSFLHVDYDKHTFALDSNRQVTELSISLLIFFNNSVFHVNDCVFLQSVGEDPPQKSAEVRIQFVIAPDQLLITLTGTIVGFLLLVIVTIIMFKMGCFRRKTLEYYQEHDHADQQNSSFIVPVGSMETDEQPELPADQKALLDHVKSDNRPSTTEADEK